jgi:hypothetical protein
MEDGQEGAMRRWLLTGGAILAVVLVSLTVVLTRGAGAVAGSRSEEHEHEAIVVRGVTSCGVERWFVKTGMDRDASKVNIKTATGTNIGHLRSLPSPGDTLPLKNRVKPVESTVWQVSGTLLRIKQEGDSDYHLVVADSGGRSMIMEAPAPQCVGKTSPFLASITYVRRVLQERFHPTSSWLRPNTPVVIKGVGFFDFLHGQSGVAPNGIELHPVLSIRFGVGTSAPPPAPPTATAARGGAIHVSARVSDATPKRYSKVTVSGTVTAGGKPVSGVAMQATWHFKTGTGVCTGRSNARGEASCSRFVGRATVGYRVVVEVAFTVAGKSYTTETGFVPQ